MQFKRRTQLATLLILLGSLGLLLPHAEIATFALTADAWLNRNPELAHGT